MKDVTQNRTRTPVHTWCLEEGGILEAFRTMGEKKVKEVVVLNRQGAVVGLFRFERGEITFETNEFSARLG